MNWYDREKPGDAWYYDTCRHNNVISLNGLGRSGKSTQARRLESYGYGVYVNPYTLRDRFAADVYSQLERTDAQQNTEVFGMASLGWMLAEFHWRIKDFLNEGQRVIFDHSLADFYVDMMEDFPDIDVFLEFIRHTKMPGFHQGHHFYLDINYHTYQSRSERVDLATSLPLADSEIPLKLFVARRERYHELVNAGYLTLIHGGDSEYQVFQKILRRLDG